MTCSSCYTIIGLYVRTDYYPIEWQRVQHALLILLMAYTSARPGVLVEY